MSVFTPDSLFNLSADRLTSGDMLELTNSMLPLVLAEKNKTHDEIKRNTDRLQELSMISSKDGFYYAYEWPHAVYIPNPADRVRTFGGEENVARDGSFRNVLGRGIESTLTKEGWIAEKDEHGYPYLKNTQTGEIVWSKIPVTSGYPHHYPPPPPTSHLSGRSSLMETNGWDHAEFQPKINVLEDRQHAKKAANDINDYYTYSAGYKKNKRTTRNKRTRISKKNKRTRRNKKTRRNKRTKRRR